MRTERPVFGHVDRASIGFFAQSLENADGAGVVHAGAEGVAAAAHLGAAPSPLDGHPKFGWLFAPAAADAAVLSHRAVLGGLRLAPGAASGGLRGLGFGFDDFPRFGGVFLGFFEDAGVGQDGAFVVIIVALRVLAAGRSFAQPAEHPCGLGGGQGGRKNKIWVPPPSFWVLALPSPRLRNNKGTPPRVSG